MAGAAAFCWCGYSLFVAGLAAEHTHVVVRKGLALLLFVRWKSGGCDHATPGRAMDERRRLDDVVVPPPVWPVGFRRRSCLTLTVTLTTLSLR